MLQISEISPCRGCPREQICNGMCAQYAQFVRSYWPLLTGYLKHKLKEKGKEHVE